MRGTNLSFLGQKMMAKYEVSDVPTDEERNEENCRGEVDVADFAEGCVLVHPMQLGKGGDGLDVRLGGYCPVALTSGQGFLVPGNPRLGLVRFRGRHYSCSSVHRAGQLGRSPEVFEGAVARLARENPQLEQVLGLGREGPSPFPGAASTSDSGVQTATHPPGGAAADPSYCWNEWDLRREALRSTASLRSSPAQTDVSGGGSVRGRAEAGSQAGSSSCAATAVPSPSSSSATQTPRESGTSMDLNRKKKSIVVGLKSKNGTAVEHILLEDLLANI